jgi:hypothetical protein
MMELEENQKIALRALARGLHQSGSRISLRRFKWALQDEDPDYADAMVRFWQETWAELEAGN